MIIFFLSILCCLTEIYSFETIDSCLVAGLYCHKGYRVIIIPEDCPIGYYCALDSSDKTECPNNKTTLQIRSSLESDCICKKGYNLFDGGDTCIHCPINTYKSEIANSDCHSCPTNSQTFNEGSESLDDCLCNAGSTFSNKDSTCISCPINTYKSEIGNSECLMCSNGLTYRNKDKMRTGCLRYSIIFGTTIP
ncbi:MAG: hypothetical protein MHPSP_002640, partial [Paramarteilia canceri]